MQNEIVINTLEDLKAEKLNILTVPNSILTSKAEPITEFNDELEVLARNMLYTMYLSPGIGLAANQIGLLKRIFVVDIDYERDEIAGSDGEEYRAHSFNPFVFINPIIKNPEGKIETKEGCLSVPEIFEMVKRFEKIEIDYQNLKGEQCSMKAEELLSVCIQHENDHLDGIVFLDHLSQLKKQFFLKKLKKEKKYMGKQLNVIFLGTPEICLPSLEYLNNHDSIHIESIISMPDRPSGRGKKLQSPATIDFAKKNNISYFQTANINKENEYLDLIEKKKIDCFIVFAFAQFLGKKMLALPRLGAFNIHTSLLPKYRGAAPIQYALMNGDQETGVSIQKMVKKMDAGDVAISYPISISEDDNQKSLSHKLQLAAPLALKQLIDNINDDSITYTEQNSENISFAPSFVKEDGRLDFINKPAIQLHNQVRGLVPWPGCFFDSSKDRIKVHKTSISNITLSAGKIENIDNHLIVGTQKGSLRLNEIQLPGKKPCRDEDFLKGYRGELEIHEK